jgi:hypothetical protein
MADATDNGYVMGDSAASRRLALTKKSGVSALLSNRKVAFLAVFAAYVDGSLSTTCLVDLLTPANLVYEDLVALNMVTNKVSSRRHLL